MGDVIKNKVDYCFFFEFLREFRGVFEVGEVLCCVLTIFVGYCLFQDVFSVLGMIIMSLHYASNAAKLLLKSKDSSEVKGVAS